MLAVVYFPQANIEQVNLLREKYDISWKLIPPHITIVSPVSELSESQLTDHIGNMVNNTEIFPIRLTGLKKTQNGCLFLMVEEGKEKIITLHDKLYSGILAPYLPTIYQFAPHITLGDFSEPNEKLLTEAYSAAQSLNPNITDNFDALTVINGDGVSPIEIVEVVKLHTAR